MQLLRQSTAVTLKIGPFLDDTDGKTAETALVIAQADVRISKNGANIIQKNEATSCTHDELGIYGCPLDITDTNTLGRFQLWVHESGALPVWHEFMVVTANFYGAVTGGDALEVDVIQISSSSTAANNLEDDYDGTGYAKANSTIGTCTTNTDMRGTDSAALATGVNVTELNGGAQSLVDLKDFADAGYDPATNKVQGVLLCDTTTTNGDAITDIIIPIPSIPFSIDLADTVQVRLSIGITNAIGDIPSTAEITPGLIYIYRKAVGGTSWITMVSAGACSEFQGRIFYEEVFDTTTGYAAGDSIKIAFASQKVVIGGVDHDITGGGSWIFQTHIREEMRGTDSAALAATALTDVTWTDAKAGHLDAPISTVDTVVDGIQTDLSNATDGLGALKALIDTIGGVVGTILADTDELQTNQGAWATATGFSTHSAADVWSVATRILTASTNFNDLDAAAVKAEVVAALADIKLDHLINIAVDTNWATTVHLDSVIGHLADVGTAATFDRTADALEAIRDRGDAAWVTATGFNTTTPPTVGEIRTEMEGAGTKLLAIEGYTDKIDDATNGLTAIKAEVEGLAGAAMRGTDGANTTVPDAAGVAPTVVEIRTEMEGAGSKILAIEGDTNELQTNQSAWATAVGFSTHDAAAVKTEVEQAGSSLAQILEDTGTSLPADIAAVSDYLLGAEIATVTDQTHITLATGSDVDDAYKDQTIVLYDDTNSDFPSVRKITAYTGATKAVTIDSAADFTVGTDDSVRIYITAPGTTAPTAVENAIAVWDRILTGATHNIATSAGRRVREIGAFAIESGTAQAGNSHSITIAATASPSDAAYHGIFNRNLIVLVDNTGVGQTRTIVDYDAITKVCVVDRDWRISPDATTAYQIVPDDTPLTVDHGVARGGTNRTITIRTYAASDDDAYLCNIVTIIAGTGRGQARLVESYDGTTNVVTICGDDWVVIPDTTSVYVMMPYGVACAACIGDEALAAIKSEADDALSDVNLHKHNETMTALMMSQY